MNDGGSSHLTWVAKDWREMSLNFERVWQPVGTMGTARPGPPEYRPLRKV